MHPYVFAMASHVSPPLAQYGRLPAGHAGTLDSDDEDRTRQSSSMHTAIIKKNGNSGRYGDDLYSCFAVLSS